MQYRILNAVQVLPVDSVKPCFINMVILYIQHILMKIFLFHLIREIKALQEIEDNPYVSMLVQITGTLIS